MIGWWLLGLLLFSALFALGLGYFIRRAREIAEAPLQPQYWGRWEPRYPCRMMPTRHCPAVYEGVCGVAPCARFESDDESPWRPEIG